MSATEELRRLLDERGVEWAEDDASHTTRWTNANGQKCSAMYWNPTLSVLISECTPEQAIEATLGHGTCRVISTEKFGDMFGYRLSCGHSMVNPFDDHPDYCPWCGRKVVDA